MSISREESVRDVVRQRVLEEVANRWRRIHATRFPGFLLSPLFGTRRLKGIFVVEHDCADVASMSCTGTAIAAWCHDHQGLRPLDTTDVDPGPTHGHVYWGSIWDRQVWRFRISADNATVIINEVEGPGDAWLSENAVVLRDGKIKLKCRRARWRDERPQTGWNLVSDICQYAIVLLPIVILIIILTMVA